MFSYAARAIPMRALQQVFSREMWEERAGHRALIGPNLQVKAKWHALILSFLFVSPALIHLSRSFSSRLCSAYVVLNTPSPPDGIFFFLVVQQRQFEQTTNPSIRLMLTMFGLRTVMIPQIAIFVLLLWLINLV